MLISWLGLKGLLKHYPCSLLVAFYIFTAFFKFRLSNSLPLQGNDEEITKLRQNFERQVKGLPYKYFLTIISK